MKVQDDSTGGEVLLRGYSRPGVGWKEGCICMLSLNFCTLFKLCGIIQPTSNITNAVEGERGLGVGSGRIFFAFNQKIATLGGGPHCIPKNLCASNNKIMPYLRFGFIRKTTTILAQKRFLKRIIL